MMIFTDQWPLGLVTLRTNDPSDQWPLRPMTFGRWNHWPSEYRSLETMFLRTNDPEDQRPLENAKIVAFFDQTSAEVVTMNRQEEVNQSSYLFSAHFADRDVMVNMYRSRLIFLIPWLCKCCWLLKQRRYEDLNWNRLAAWALHRGINQLHYVYQCIATDHSREKCRSRAVSAGLLHFRVWSMCVCLWDFRGWRHNAGPHRK